MRSVVVFGAGGRTGRLIVERALSGGDQVTAVARRPGTVTDLDRRWAHTGRLRVATADVRDAASVVAVTSGHDAAVSAIAGRGRHPGGLFSDGTRAIVDALEASGVRRFVAVSSRGVNYQDRGLPFAYRAVIRPLVLREVYADMQIMERIIRTSTLDWTLVRPPRLIDRPARGTYRVEDGRNPRGGWVLARADLAAFVTAELHGGEWTHRAPTLAY
jgi:putative NADH-flavin reductase